MKRILLLLLTAAFLFSGCALTQEQYVTREEMQNTLQDFATKQYVANRLIMLEQAIDKEGFVDRKEVEKLIQDLTLKGTGDPQAGIVKKLLEMLESTAANKIRAFTEIEGGGSGAMDAIAGDDLSDQDLGFAFDLNSSTIYFYEVNVDGSCEADNSPFFIAWDDCGTATNKGQWELLSGFGFGRSATPKTIYRDSDATDYDDNVYWQVNCTTTGTGAEDCNIDKYQQVDGAILKTESGIADITAEATDSWKGNGTIIGIAGEAVDFGQLVYLSGDGKFDVADADEAVGEDHFPAWGFAVECSDTLGVDCGDTDTIVILYRGEIKDTTWSFSDENVILYLSDTAGAVTETAPSSTGDCVQPVGRSKVITNDVLHISVDPVIGWGEAQ